jgi:hypothetical protein
MTHPHFSIASSRLAIVALLAASHSLSHAAPPAFVIGDPVSVTRSEMLLFQGKNLAGAAKKQEFTLLKHDAAKKQVFVSFMKDDGTLIAATLPDEAVEPGTPRATSDLLRGAEAFRDQRYDEAKRLLTRASQTKEDKQLAALAGAIFTRVNGAIGSASLARTSPAAKQAATTTLQTLRDTADSLAKAGMPSLALALDDGADRLGAQVPGLTVPATKVDRADLAKRAAISQRETMLARQTFALKQLVAASKHVAAGLEAEPAHAELKAMQPVVQKDLDEADTLCKTAKKLQRQPNGAVHALSAIDDGLKLCTDHTDLRELRKSLAAAFEEKTSPQVTPAFLAMAKVGTSAPMLEEGRKLYTNRCTECHDLEMLDGRNLSSLAGMVGNMSRRAGLNETEKARILDYIAAAKIVVDAGGAK